jgi:hypothetical protein
MTGVFDVFPTSVSLLQRFSEFASQYRTSGLQFSITRWLMNFMDKVKESFDKAKDEVSEFAEATVLKHEISKLNDKRVSLLQDIGQEAYSMCRNGHGVLELAARCREVQDIDEQIQGKSDEIARLAAA